MKLEAYLSTRRENGSCLADGHDARASHDYPVAMFRLVLDGHPTYVTELRFCVDHWDGFRRMIGDLPAFGALKDRAD